MISFTSFMGNRNWVVELELIPCIFIQNTPHDKSVKPMESSPILDK